MKRRKMIAITSQGIGLLTLQACGNSSNSPVVSSGSVTGLRTVADLRSARPKYNGELFEVLGHTLEGIGGGLFYFDADDITSNDDGGSVIVGNGNRYKRRQPTQPTAEMFGAQVNPNYDQSIFINRCIAVYGICFLEGRKTYNIYHQIQAIALKTFNDGIATLNCVSPTATNKFGSTGAAVYAAGSLLTPLQGVDIQNIAVNCNSLLNADGSDGLKGFWLYRCRNFFQKSCLVFKCASHAYWDTDDYQTGVVYGSGIRELCSTVDATVGFGQLNIFDITLNNCSAYISTDTLSFMPKALFQPEGKDEMGVTLNNCSGVADGPCPTIFLATKNCTNVTASDCTFINNNLNDASGNAIYFEHASGNFDNFTFRNCTIKSLYSTAAVLSVGENGLKRATIKFTDCRISGHEIGVKTNGLNGIYSFIGCNTTGTADGSVAPYAYFEHDSMPRGGAIVSVIGGSATAAGPEAITTTNMSAFIYTNTILTPPDFSNGPVIAVRTIAELRTIKPKYNRQQFELLGYAQEGIGGGLFYYDEDDVTSIDDGGSVIVSDGKRFKRVPPAKPTAEMFGAQINPNEDQSVFINNCTTAYGECYLAANQIYNIQNTLDVKVLKCVGGVATINCVSPTYDNRFGSLYAAVSAAGTAQAPLEGVDVQNIIINCNGLIGSVGNTGIKGTLFIRLKNFYQRGCTVKNSASYGYWDTDTAETGTIFCTGTRDDCWAIDCSVSFEQVNVRGVTLNNCHGYISTNTPDYIVECIFHPYGGSDMQVVYNNCTGIADGNCPAVFLALLTCKNVAANDCAFINNNNGGGRVRTSLYFNSSGGDFDNFMFKNCIIKATHSPAMYLDVGENGSTNAKFKFTDCLIDGAQLGVQINGPGGIYSFFNCETTGTSDVNSTPFAYYANGISARDNSTVIVIGGSASAIGPKATKTTNITKNIYTSTVLMPAPTIGELEVRQENIGTGILKWDGSYAYLNIRFQTRIADQTKVMINATINAIGASTGGEAASWSTPLTWINMDGTYYRIYAPAEFAGRTVRYTMTEYK